MKAFPTLGVGTRAVPGEVFLQASRKPSASARRHATALSVGCLLTAGIATSGCIWVIDHFSSACTELKQAAVHSRVYLSSGPPENRLAVITLHEGGGLQLELVPWERRCSKLSPEQVELWAGTVARLATDLQSSKTRSPGGALAISLGDDVARSPVETQAPLVSTVVDLEPESLEGVFALSCLALATFGQRAVIAIQGAAPELGAHPDFPWACRHRPSAHASGSVRDGGSG